MSHSGRKPPLVADATERAKELKAILDDVSDDELIITDAKAHEKMVAALLNEADDDTPKADVNPAKTLPKAPDKPKPLVRLSNQKKPDVKSPAVATKVALTNEFAVDEKALQAAIETLTKPKTPRTDSIGQLIDEIIQIGQPSEPAAKNQTKKEQGTYNVVDFRVLTGNVPVAWSKSLSVQGAKDNKEAQKISAGLARVLALLNIKKVDMRFLQQFLYFSSQGEKVSLKAPKLSLHHYLLENKSKLPLEQIKNIFGQIVLGIFALHQKNLVHRDLKGANILVFQDSSGHLNIKIADLDSITEVINKQGQIRSSDQNGSYRPPEFKNIFEESTNQFKKGTLDTYNALNHKAVDCYALGCILANLAKSAHPNLSLADQNDLMDLYKKLTAPKAEDRMTIEGVLTHKFFQLTTLEQQPIAAGIAALPPFLQKIHASEDVALLVDLDGYVPVSRIINDPFHLLQPEIKILIDLSEQLLNKLNYFDSHAHTAEKDFLALLSVTKAAKNLFDHLEKLNRALLKENNKMLREKTTLLGFVFACKINEKIMLAIQNPDNIIQVIENAIKRYIAENKLNENPSIFAKHGTRGKNNAIKFGAEINGLKNKPTSEILKAIIDFIGKKPPSDPKSFKSMLHAEFAAILLTISLDDVRQAVLQNEQAGLAKARSDAGRTM